MTRDQIKDLVIENTRRRDKEDLILTAIAFALTEIAQKHDFKIMRVETTIPFGVDATSVTLPTDAVQVGEIRFVDTAQPLTAYVLPLRFKNTVVGTFPNAEAASAGRPSEVYEAGGELFFNVPSDSDYELRVTYWKYPEELADGTDSPLIPHLDNAIVCYCTSYVFRSIQMYDDAKHWRGEFELALDRAISADNRKSGTRVQIEPYPGRVVQPAVPPYLDPLAQRDWP